MCQQALLSIMFGFGRAGSQYLVDFPKILLLIASGFAGVPAGAVYALPTFWNDVPMVPNSGAFATPGAQARVKKKVVPKPQNVEPWFGVNAMDLLVECPADVLRLKNG